MGTEAVLMGPAVGGSATALMVGRLEAKPAVSVAMVDSETTEVAAVMGTTDKRLRSRQTARCAPQTHSSE